MILHFLVGIESLFFLLNWCSSKNGFRPFIRSSFFLFSSSLERIKFCRESEVWMNRMCLFFFFSLCLDLLYRILFYVSDPITFLPIDLCLVHAFISSIVWLSYSNALAHQYIHLYIYLLSFSKDAIEIFKKVWGPRRHGGCAKVDPWIDVSSSVFLYQKKRRKKK